jgi:hypothetical protein
MLCVATFNPPFLRLLPWFSRCSSHLACSSGKPVSKKRKNGAEPVRGATERGAVRRARGRARRAVTCGRAQEGKSGGELILNRGRSCFTHFLAENNHRVMGHIVSCSIYSCCRVTNKKVFCSGYPFFWGRK